MSRTLNTLKSLKEKLFVPSISRNSLVSSQRRAPLSTKPQSNLISSIHSDTGTSGLSPNKAGINTKEDMSTDPIITEDAVVHFVYNVDNPPPRPDAGDAASAAQNGSSTWTRFICISDTHCNTFKVPDGDVLLHAGDLTHTGRFKQMKPTISWLKNLPHPHKIIIAGNHDLTLDHDWYLENGDGWHRTLENPPDVRKLMEPDEGDPTFHYLQYESTEISHGNTRWKVYGSPGSPWYGGWAFNYDRETESQGIANAIPEDVDILLTHGPPHRILDQTHAGIHAGCEALTPRVEHLRPAIHIFGHIHEARGAIVKEWPDHDENTASAETGDEAVAASEGGTAATKKRKCTVFVNAAVAPFWKNQHHLLLGSEDRHYPAIIVDIRNG